MGSGESSSSSLAPFVSWFEVTANWGPGKLMKTIQPMIARRKIPSIKKIVFLKPKFRLAGAESVGGFIATLLLKLDKEGGITSYWLKS